MPNPIPRDRRIEVQLRDGRCVRCNGPATDWHHRRTRSVKDVHQNCSCNGVWVCRSCHAWAHAHPAEARELGLIVSRYEPSPWTESVKYVDGWWDLDCHGGASPKVDRK